MVTQNDTPAGNPAEVPVYEARTLYQVPIDRVLPDPNQPRKSFDAQARNTLSEILSLNKLPQDVRDDCRGDRTISKNALITIAKKKQARSMTTAYIAYKAKQQKGKTTRQKKDPNEPQAVFDMMDKAITKIRSIDMSAWTDDDKTNFQTSLTSLKTKIDNYLNAPPASKNLA
jgi:ParB family chromosome partitioning protein